MVRADVNAEDVALAADWKECRRTIGRLDTILVDLRKLGFTVATTLLTADALFATQDNHDPKAITMAVIVVMVLVDALFALDTYYQCLLEGAVERASSIEDRIWPPLQATKHITSKISMKGAETVVVFVYAVLIVAAMLLALALGPADVLFLVWPVAAGVISLGFIIWYWRYMRTVPKPLALSRNTRAVELKCDTDDRLAGMTISVRRR